MTAPPWAFQAVASASHAQFADPMLPTRPAGLSGYDAINSTGKRKSFGPQPRSEDHLLRNGNRDRLTATGRDLDRNFSLFAWVIQQHLNFVCDMNFFPDTGSADLDQELEGRVEEWSKAENWDVVGLHHRDQWVRLAEASTLTGGDMLDVRIAGGYAQGIEGDRIRNPDNANNSWQHGVQRDEYGRHVNYCVWNRGQSGIGFEKFRIVPARNAHLLGYFKRFDQIRGVSPLASAFNSFRDTYESLEHAQQRAKIANILAFIINRAGTENVFNYDDVELAGGPSIIDMNAEDKGDFLESKLPSLEFQAFVREEITLALKAVDVPMSFYREDLTNFYGSRAAVGHYIRSCKWKRARLQTMLHRRTGWRVGLWLASREIRLPRSMDPNALKYAWLPAGIPWWDPAKEVSGDMLAVSAGWGDPYEISLERTGRTLTSNLRRRAYAMKEAETIGKEVGVNLTLNYTPPSTAPADASNGKDNAKPDQATDDEGK